MAWKSKTNDKVLGELFRKGYSPVVQIESHQVVEYLQANEFLVPVIQEMHRELLAICPPSVYYRLGMIVSDKNDPALCFYIFIADETYSLVERIYNEFVFLWWEKNKSRVDDKLDVFLIY